jgi:hypothetical protein
LLSGRFAKIAACVLTITPFRSKPMGVELRADAATSLPRENVVADDLTDEQIVTAEMADWQLAAFERMPADERAEFVRKLAGYERRRLGLEREPSTVDERQPAEPPEQPRTIEQAAEQGDKVAASALKTLREWRKNSPIPSESQLNAMSDEQEAAWAGVELRPLRPPKVSPVANFVHVLLVRARVARPRESRAARRTRDRSPPADRPRPADDDEADLDRAEAAA